MAMDIVGIFKEVMGFILEIFLFIIKIPLQIWFVYTPEIMRLVIVSFLFYLSLCIIAWSYLHRYDWMHVG